MPTRTGPSFIMTPLEKSVSECKTNGSMMLDELHSGLPVASRRRGSLVLIRLLIGGEIFCTPPRIDDFECALPAA